MIGKIAAGVLGGLVVAVLGLSVALITGIRLASDPGSGVQAGIIAFVVFWILALAFAVTAKRAAKAWRRLLVAAGILSFSLPFSSLSAGIPTGEYLRDLGGVGVTDATTIGFFLGLIFLVIGLRVGRDRPVPTRRRRERRLIHRRREPDRRTTLRWDIGGEDRRHRSGRRQEDEWGAMKAELARSF